jgi:hypothetical protein
MTVKPKAFAKSPPELSESIKVSPYVKKALDNIKDEEQHTSLDSVIRMLLILRAVLIRLFPEGFVNVKSPKRKEKE